MRNYLDDAKLLWNYHHFNNDIVPSNGIIAFGSHDLHVAQRAAALYLMGFGEYIIFTGGLGRITEKLWKKTEAEKFAEIAISMGVPSAAIIIEDRSTNTGQNISNTKTIIEKRNIPIESVIAVDKPFKERRLYATLKKQWAELNFSVTSPQNTFEEYILYYKDSPELSVDDFINIMVGDIQRMNIYGKNGFQIEVDIPKEVWSAYERLVNLGFNKQLLK